MKLAYGLFCPTGGHFHRIYRVEEVFPVGIPPKEPFIGCNPVSKREDPVEKVLQVSP
nr:hypothetical protein [Salinibacter ruber]